MRVFRSLDEARSAFGPASLTIGNFDGCHLGHQSIFRQVTLHAAERGLKPSVLTFDPHPSRVVAPDRTPKLLSTIPDRCRWMAECGIQQVMILPFNVHIASLSPQEFVFRVLVGSLNAKAVLIGDNFRFGNRQTGDTATLATLGAELGFETHTMKSVASRGVTVSSTEIRSRILLGDVSRAARMLGRFYALEGTVVPGHGIGSKQTVPTLNLSTAAEVLPAIGVYVTRTTSPSDGRTWPSVTNIGYRPTFSGESLSIETFLLAPLAGESPSRIQVEFTHRLRDERKFPSPDLLKSQILADVQRANAWHRRYTNSLHA